MQTVQGSAKIYQFPVRVRSTNDAAQAEAQAAAARAAQIPCVDFGGGWYHDAAIEEVTPKLAPLNVSPFVRH